MGLNNREFSTYSKDDVIFLLKDITDTSLEQNNEEREKAIQSGKHYSEMLPIEYQVSDRYLNLYREKLDLYKEKLAYCVGVMAEKILEQKGKNVVIVSLARAGTPIGILTKRYIKKRYNLSLPHYTISIIRDKGIDENAIKYILKNHKGMKIQFIDGWTGKGTICDVLKTACDTFFEKYNIKLDRNLAVLADPAGYSNAFGVREDFLIPSACLNSTVSGLVSRTVLRSDLIQENDFHGAKYYKELKMFDESNDYLDKISQKFENVYEGIDKYMEAWTKDEITKLGYKDVENIIKELKIKDVNYVKPGIGETTRVLLRRIPYKILVKDLNDTELNHIFVLANEKNIPIEEYPLKAYRCCGIIKNIKDI
ncbi:cysteine protease StiP family protein [Clostridium sp. OS1-26]|uniref:cysteine protease StiP family protein n=1 Tax=Clostridium sp. OS1-26 TaxID=3070681 RepID=UPI0027DFC3C0|nr:cysteine protease StiP family protein [Clostridium sp. OS1-26]WML36889.1 cysteine protease StiP family protein [Clostridium sp. OS1-26]